MAKSPDDFENHTRKYYRRSCLPSGYEPELVGKRMQDAHEAFCVGKNEMENNFLENKKYDHFDMTGILVYWLQRFQPVTLRDLSSVRGAPDYVIDLLRKYPSEALAFDFGLSICDYFESQKKENPTGKPAVKDDNLEYYNKICRMMKFKSMPPHSLCMIYRTLYVSVLLPE